MASIPSNSNDAEPLIQYRNATNFKTIQRNDSSVVEVVETSVYSVIYHYDEVSSKWAKQKQEGSLFIVRREKAPEHALFMLNRQTVKNVTIPLIPGEMKVTIVDEAMIQVARRKQKPHIGIWFSEGADGVGRFKDAILRICGEPSVPGSKGTPVPSSNSIPPSGQSQPVDDGFSRLFAGLMTSSTAQSSPPQATQTTTTTTQTTTTTIDLPTERPLLYDHREISAQSPPSDVPSLPLESVHPPGQTVDDLLMSILGGSPAPRPSMPQPPAIERQDIWQSPALSHPALRTKVGDATFAQAAKSPPPPQPPIHMSDGPSYVHHPGDIHTMHHGHPQPSNHKQATTAATRDAVLDSMVSRPMMNGAGTSERDPKVDFINNLLRLVHTDPGFVEELWAGYLARMDGRRGHPG